MSNPEAKKVVTNEANYWNSFYDNKFSVGVPSQFCCLVAIEAPKTRPFVEFGCGNGRDSNYSEFHMLCSSLFHHVVATALIIV